MLKGLSARPAVYLRRCPACSGMGRMKRPGARSTGITIYSARITSSLNCSSTMCRELQKINRTLMELGPHYQARYMATNDLHYINPEDAKYQDILLAIQTGALLTDPDRMRMTDGSYYLRSPEEMAGLFAEVPGVDLEYLAHCRAMQCRPERQELPAAAFRSPPGIHRRNLPAETLRRRGGAALR